MHLVLFNMMYNAESPHFPYTYALCFYQHYTISLVAGRKTQAFSALSLSHRPVHYISGLLDKWSHLERR